MKYGKNIKFLYEPYMDLIKLLKEITASTFKLIEVSA